MELVIEYTICGSRKTQRGLGDSSVPPLIKYLVVRQLIFHLSHSQLLLKMCTPVRMAANTVRGWWSQEKRREGAQKDGSRKPACFVLAWHLSVLKLVTSHCCCLAMDWKLLAWKVFSDHCCMISSSLGGVARSNTTKLQEAWALYQVLTLDMPSLIFQVSWLQCLHSGAGEPGNEAKILTLIKAQSTVYGWQSF